MCKAHSKVTHIKQQKYFHSSSALDIIQSCFISTSIYLSLFPMKCSIFCWVSEYILIVNVKVQLCCIVTGSCRPFHRSSHLMYTYYTGLGRELFVSVTFIIIFLCLSLLHLHLKLLQISTRCSDKLILLFIYIIFISFIFVCLRQQYNYYHWIYLS